MEKSKKNNKILQGLAFGVFYCKYMRRMLYLKEDLLKRRKDNMNFQGIIIGLASFLIIGIFHPIVIKGEYYIGRKIWPAFLLLGLILIGLSMFIDNVSVSAIVGVTGFSSLWSIHEIFEQEERVKKGWFPYNENKDA